MLFPINVSAQSQPEPTASSPFLPIGSGARAMGMGGAFIAVADDATASSWNPAGLVQLKRPEISLVGSLFNRQDRSVFDEYPEASTSEHITKYHLNFLSMVLPIRFLGRNLVCSLNYQHLYDMNLRFRRKWHYKYQEDTDPLPFDLDITWDYRKEGSLSTISPALAIQILPALSMGITVNFWPKKIGAWDNGWTQEFHARAQDTDQDENQSLSFDSITYKNYCYRFSGTNYHLGFMWQINSIFTLGAVMKTSFSAKLDMEVEKLSIDQDENKYDYEYEEERQKQTLTMPPSYGLGLAARLLDKMTLSLDIYRTEWEKHKLDTGEKTLSAVTDNDIRSSTVKPTHHIRMGLEYLIISRRRIVALRSGIFYDPDPSKDNPNDYYGFSLGAGIALKNIAIDCAYQFRYAEDTTTIYFNGKADNDRIIQQFIYLSTIYYL